MSSNSLDPSATPPRHARIAAALAVSLTIHVALLFLVRIMPAPRPAVQVKILQVELGERIRPSSQIVGVVIDSPRALRRVDRPILREPVESPPDPEQGNIPKTAPADIDLPQPPPPKAPLLPTLDMPLVDDPTYYTAKELDVFPQAAGAPPAFNLDTPALAAAEGYVVLNLRIEDSGLVSEVSVVESDPPGILDETAVAAFRNVRFIPAQRNGRMVKSEMRYKVEFKLDKPDSGKKSGESRGR
jgi:periplasmic protein TonB